MTLNVILAGRGTGDAVHPMSPCGGGSAQTTVCDADSLDKIFISSE